MIQAAYVLPMGVVLGGLLAETRSLWPGIFVHLGTNIISVTRVFLV